ncbi:hypothetical protein ABIE09_002966 [Lysobacter enzymogenes]|uniref:hypothetical protein n=1 Tax=Lysobacter enzymogenes TaxID=69 RepID=UPI00339B7782
MRIVLCSLRWAHRKRSVCDAASCAASTKRTAGRTGAAARGDRASRAAICARKKKAAGFPAAWRIVVALAAHQRIIGAQQAVHVLRVGDVERAGGLFQPRVIEREVVIRL